MQRNQATEGSTSKTRNSAGEVLLKYRNTGTSKSTGRRKWKEKGKVERTEDTYIGVSEQSEVFEEEYWKGIETELMEKVAHFYLNQSPVHSTRWTQCALLKFLS